MTRELIASMLGVRREGVTEAAGRLQAAGLIQYSRGKITVLDRPKLETVVCDFTVSGLASPLDRYTEMPDHLVCRSPGHCSLRPGTRFTTSDHTIPADAASMHSNRSDTARPSNLNILCIGGR